MEERETTPSFKPVREFAPKLKNSHAIVALLQAQKMNPSSHPLLQNQIKS